MPGVPRLDPVDYTQSAAQKPTPSHIVGRSRWIFGPSVLVLAGLLASGCANADVAGAGNDIATVSEKIVGGAKDTGALASSSVVALKVGASGAKDFELCSAAFIGPNILLTARHCVTKAITDKVSCDENGNSTNGDHVDGNLDPSEIEVFRGASPKFSGAPDATVTDIVAPDGGSLCNTDIAIIVIDTSFDDIEPLAIRMKGTAVSPGESIRSVGYGANDQGSPIGTRFRKDDVSVLAIGAGVSTSKTALGSHEFEVGQAICPGDSGGPAINEESGAIIGIVSRGSDANCKINYGNIYTMTMGWDDLVTRAFGIAGGAPIVETGTPTVSGATLQSRTISATPANTEPSTGGCATGPRHHGGNAGVCLLALGTAALVRRRRRAG